MSGGNKKQPSRQWQKLKPEKGWVSRCGYFVRHKWIPSLYTKRLGGVQEMQDWTPPDDGIWLNWIGHASFWIQMGGYSLMIDPNWALWHGPIKRVRHPGLALSEMPELDLVLVSHAHYDHLHKPSLRHLDARMGIVVPKRCGKMVGRLGFPDVTELDLEETKVFHGGTLDIPLSVTLTRVQHWGARTIHDGYRGYGGFVIQAGDMTLFHCGDSAYFDGFKKIGEQYDIDVALLPIGAYGTPSGRSMHMNPEEAVQTFIDLGAKWMIPMHYATFPLGTETKGEPLQRLIQEMNRLEIQDKLIILKEGVAFHLE